MTLPALPESALVLVRFVKLVGSVDPDPPRWKATIHGQDHLVHEVLMNTVAWTHMEGDRGSVATCGRLRWEARKDARRVLVVEPDGRYHRGPESHHDERREAGPADPGGGAPRA